MSKNGYGNGIGTKILDFEAQLYGEMCEAEIRNDKYGKYNLKRAQIRWGVIRDLMTLLRLKGIGEE
jgi:hypothetical protein